MPSHVLNVWFSNDKHNLYLQLLGQNLSHAPKYLPTKYYARIARRWGATRICQEPKDYQINTEFVATFF
jgi:hypothetical protein